MVTVHDKKSHRSRSDTANLIHQFVKHFSFHDLTRAINEWDKKTNPFLYLSGEKRQA